MEAEQLRFLLAELEFSADLPPDVLSQLAAKAGYQAVPSSTVLFRERGRNGNLYLIRSGRLALEMNVPGRGSVRILTLGPGEMAGWSSLLDQGQMTASALVVEDCEVVILPAAKLRDLCAANPEFGFHLMRQMATALAKRLVATRLQLLDLFADRSEATSASAPQQKET